MLNQSLRYAPIMELVRNDAGRGPILEIGAGANGLARFVRDRAVIGVDLKFSTTPHRRMSAVTASAAALPFRDRTFPLVVSCDMFEHIPPDIRALVVHEMIRVCSGRVVLTFPAGPNALAHDRWLHRQLGRLHLPTPGWLDEHLDLDPPDVATTIAWAESSGARVSTIGNANRVLHQWLVLAEELKPIAHVTSRLVTRPLPGRLVKAMSRGEVYRAMLTITPPAPALV